MTRRLGQVNLLLSLSQLYPVSFKRTMAVFYVKDAVFYILYSIIPLVGGIAVAAPLAGVTYAGVALLGLTMFLTFMLGMSLSFLISAAAVRARAAAGAIGLLVLALVALVYPLGILRPGHLVLPLGYWYSYDPLYLLASVGLAVLLSIGAVLLTKERFEAPQGVHEEMLLPLEERFAFTGDMRTLVAKEWVELRRSGMMAAFVTGFLGPLLGIYILVWVFQVGMGVAIDFNVVFYGCMVGFLGTMNYSWLTNLEPNEFLNVQPVTVDKVIRAKLILYFLLTVGISFAYVIIIGIVNGDIPHLPLALLVAGATTVYVAAVTTLLTGLWTNTMMFDARVLGKFSGTVIPPLIAVTIASFLMDAEALAATVVIVAVSVVLLVVSWALFKRVPVKWGGVSFSFATTGAAKEA